MLSQSNVSVARPQRPAIHLYPAVPAAEFGPIRSREGLDSVPRGTEEGETPSDGRATSLAGVCPLSGLLTS